MHRGQLLVQLNQQSHSALKVGAVAVAEAYLPHPSHLLQLKASL
jgi:hypothetical protein